MPVSFDLSARDSVLDPYDSSDDRPVFVRVRVGQKPRYRVHIYLEGPSLPYVERVTYILHPSFRNRERVRQRSMTNPNAKLTIWTWGVFSLQAWVEDRWGAVYEFHYSLTYGQEVRRLMEQGVRFEKV